VISCLFAGLWACGGSTNPGTGGPGQAFAPDPIIAAMPLISQGAPAFAADGSSAAAANDGMPNTAYESATLPASVAYDLSAVPAAQRQKVLIAWYAPKIEDYIDNPTQPFMELPVDYTIEVNTAPGGGQPPASGWTNLLTVAGNDRSSRQHLANLAGANWVRMTVTASSNPSPTTTPGAVAFDLDIHAAPAGATDDWLFMGDSITFMTMARAFSDLPARAQAGMPTHYPAVIDAAIGGTFTVTAASVIDDTMSLFPGQFVVLAYGTNDNPNNFQMETLVQHVLAAGKTPVVPHMPWSAMANIQTNGPLINAQIDALYAKYPQIIRGPDLWAFFNGRTDLIPATDIHPNTEGQKALRQQWANLMVSLYE
jgi:hypothetical protein